MSNCRVLGSGRGRGHGDRHARCVGGGGPDGCGLFWQRSRGVALGHRRLAVLDLSPAGHQPMVFGDMAIAYNGEIYNFREIRQELQARGYTFASETDTEVLLKGLHCWGPEVVTRCRGMWAFACGTAIACGWCGMPWASSLCIIGMRRSAGLCLGTEVLFCPSPLPP
ncbi:MAG: hypothetical protein HC918_02725 [Oscillatoriales cyanobacterium SM2_1_8]|nr:hypothetical protein [Oscillatoriales cyanobacterium SM2_1_8]